MNQPRFYVFARRFGWDIRDRRRFHLPVHDNAPDGKDAPLVFFDQDQARDVCDDMNRRHAAGEDVN